MLKKAQRLRKGDEIRKVLDKGRGFEENLFKVFMRPSEKSLPRLGILASRRVGNAVQRNRIKRLFREAFRSIAGEIKGGVDIVILPRAKSRLAPLEETKGKLRRIFEEARILKGYGD